MATPSSHDELPAELRARLERVMRGDYIDTWLDSAVPMLDGQTPLEVIGAGELDRVAEMVDNLEYPGIS